MKTVLPAIYILCLCIAVMAQAIRQDTTGEVAADSALDSAATVHPSHRFTQPRARTVISDTVNYDPQGHPYIQLDNDTLQVSLYLPGTYYRGSRFDWSGMIAQVRSNGHTFYQPWVTPHKAHNPEHGIGPAEEFDIDTPPLFKKAGPGGLFMKIGVGMLRRESEKKYFFNRPYEIVHTGSRTMQCLDNVIVSTHELSAKKTGYRYEKKLSVSGATLTIAHTLINTGSEKISTMHYSHNFTIIDSTPIGDAYEVVFPFEITVDKDIREKYRDYMRCSDSTLDILKPLGSRSLYMLIEGHDRRQSHNAMTVRNTQTNAAVTIKGDIPARKIALYAVEGALCPEPFVAIECVPADTVQWSSTYTFETGVAEK